jgi:hypothetical protein
MDSGLIKFIEAVQIKGNQESPSEADLKEIQNIAYRCELSSLPKELLTEKTLLKTQLGSKRFRSPMFILGSVLSQDWNEKRREEAKAEFQALLPHLSFEGLNKLYIELIKEHLTKAAVLCKPSITNAISKIDQTELKKLTHDPNPFICDLAEKETKKRLIIKGLKEKENLIEI